MKKRFVPKMENPPPNSMKQANDNYQNWKDRHDVKKALEEWARKEFGLIWPDLITYDHQQMKEFAIFFAERVKGRPIEQFGKSEQLNLKK